ncbi:MAG: hypothetical protein JXB19_11270 [Bacteroidales bacterium]|nr:hypothetical protein [Bacteroidales bacterium]
MNELGIIHIKEIERTIKSMHEYDFSGYAMTSFKYRLERLMMKYNIQEPEHLIKKIQDEPDFFDNFLFDISIPSTEMFRDPSLWRWLREEYFTESIGKNPGKFKIWLPLCVSGGELYSLAILLSELELLEQVQIIATSISATSIDIIKTGQYDLKKIAVSEENYNRANGIKELSTYYTIDRYYAYLDTSLIKNVEFNKVNIIFDHSPQNVKLILFRNSLIYYNPSLQESILGLLHSSLSAGGHLIVGIKEINSFRDFEIVNEAESVYKKKPGR